MYFSPFICPRHTTFNLRTAPKVSLLLKADPTTVDIKNNDTARGGHTAMQLCHDDEVKALLRGEIPPSRYVSPVSIYSQMLKLAVKLTILFFQVCQNA